MKKIDKKSAMKKDVKAKSIAKKMGKMAKMMEAHEASEMKGMKKGVRKSRGAY